MATIFTRLKESVSSFYNNTILSLFRKLFNKNQSILLLGVQNAGKTTLVQKLKTGLNKTCLPTRHPKQEEIEIGNLKCLVQDVGGHEPARLIWDQYFYASDGIVFIIDCTDKQRYVDAREELRKLVESAKKNGKAIPIAILVNKIDLLQYSVHNVEDDYQFCDQMRTIFDINEETNNSIKVFFTSITQEDLNDSDTPIVQSFVWLESAMKASVEGNL